ncbi:MAG: hypothetical protein DI570_03980 [Phenylobacterium zucineum]|nr:MAG: hypothetical protein DI570_03980 [Phenylobacterium zucineum]
MSRIGRTACGTLASAAVLAIAGPALSAEARAAARAVIVEPMSVRVSWPMAMPSVQGAVDGASFMGVMPSMSMGMTMPANARLVIRREDDTGETVTAPGSFEVTRTAPDTVVVRTTPATVPTATRPTPLAGGSLQGRAAASIEVARGPALDAGRSGLQVVVQYN